ncbi:hypothetical protein LTR84_001704 [Exophiala bonariae]|uniref:MFS maltose permease n=1 Tax=Exophiala bonariae TaxID=1690606 RepID=A0AAV9NBC1_9EURO|nr:hypothetical protein LTR84_001704 [Exophiala bonariae]
MASTRVITRQSALHPLHHSTPPRPRSFTHRPSLLFVARPIPRPQLPFLNTVSRANIIQTQVGRFISTERKQRWKDNFWRQVRFHSYLWPSIFLIVVVMNGLKHVKLESEYPTPPDWSFWSRWEYRMARYTELDDEAKIHRVLTDWGKVGVYYTQLLERLESEKYDGKHLVRATASSASDEGDGLDISAKSEQWQRGYINVLMAAARAAEHLQGMCRRKDDPKGKIYPRECIPGPDNPRPKPLPWDRNKAHINPPTADEVEDAFPSPQFFYEKLLTTESLSTRQRLDAALAYADWIEFTGEVEVSDKWYQRGVMIASRALPANIRGSVVDLNSGVINKAHDHDVTDNVLRASTALAVHHARTGRVKEALPIFLSVLRARKSLPPSPFGATGEKQRPKRDDSPVMVYVSALKDVLVERPYPPAPPTGDERPYHTLKEACEEVALMTYIGEILFATSESEREKGLGWTRDSVDAAEAVMWVMDEQAVNDGRETCRQCLETGLQNWKAMAREMARYAVKKVDEVQNGSGLLSLGIGKSSGLEKARREAKRWEDEGEVIELRIQKTLPLAQASKPDWKLNQS